MIGFTAAANGIQNSLAQFNQAADNVVRAALPAQNVHDSVDLSTAAVSLLQAKNSFDANTKVFKTVDELDKTLLNAIG
jgi:flagellar hook protein FlgE